MRRRSVTRRHCRKTPARLTIWSWNKVTDIVHVAGYVGKAAKVVVWDEAGQEEFIRVRRLRIPRGDVHRVVRGLLRMATAKKLSKEKRAHVDPACGYFTAHASCLKYDEYLAARLPIATGVIEGVWRHLVKDRLKRTGMLWSASGAQGMLSLRCLKASNAWDELQQQCLNPTPSRSDPRKCGLTRVRNFSLSLLKHKSDKHSVATRGRMCGWSEEYLMQVLVRTET